MKKQHLAIIALLSAAALGLSACTGSSGEPDNKHIKIGAVEGWDDSIAYSMLWEAVLDDNGYDTEVDFQDVSINFVGLSEGEIDLYLGAVLPNTHGALYEEYKDNFENYGVWNDQATNTIAVNEDAPINSLEELADHADEFDNTIVGIEAGAGLTQVVEDQVIPEYGLESMNFLTSSTPAMLTELTKKIEAGENVAVTLWQPHWVYNKLPIKNLEDPKNAFGGAEEITALGRTGFAEEHPEVAQWIESFEMDMDTLASLMSIMSDVEDQEQRQEVLHQWMEENQDFVDGMTAE